MKEICYQIELVPDLTLNKYASLEGSGVDGVLEKHNTFLRQWNRKGAMSNLSMHLFYYYLPAPKRKKGNRLEIIFMVRGEEDSLKNVEKMVEASALSDFYRFQKIPAPGEMLAELSIKKKQEKSERIEMYNSLLQTEYSFCSAMSKKEVFIKNGSDAEVYYTVPEWDMNEEGRLFGMMKLMQALDKPLLYRIDLFPVEKSADLREALRKPVGILRERQNSRMASSLERDYEAENVLRSYEDLTDKVDSSPHFIANAFVFSSENEDSAVVLDSAVAEALKKGNYTISTFGGRFHYNSFFEISGDHPIGLFDRKSKIVMQKGQHGLVVCEDDAQSFKLNYLPTLFTLEEASPLFRLPALYEGEIIEKRKETAPQGVDETEGLYLGNDENGYEVYFPLEKLEKHAFIAGVPGSGKTNTMHHITSTLWKKHRIPFLVLEPAKQEYRALANENGMEDLYIFSPNADMSFPLHINPFEFPKGLMLAEHIRRLVSVFEGAFPLDNPMPFLLDTAIEAVYRELKWLPETVYTDKTKLKFPTMSMLYKRLEDELKSTTYSEEIRGNLESALKVRIGSLLRREMGDVFDVPESTIPPEKWITIPAVIELESMGTGPANFLTLMLCALIREVLKVNPHHDKPYARHIIFIEEAHNLIGPESDEVTGNDANPKQAATAFVVKMLAEVRALKEGIVIADQLPTVMAQEVIKNTGLKIGLRITSADDRNLLGSTMAANALQMEEMATFNVGEALISYEGLMRPFKVRMNEWCGEYASEVKKNIVISKNDSELRELMLKRPSYNEICNRSYIIAGKKYYSDYLHYKKQIEELIRFANEVNETKAERDRIQAVITKIEGSTDRESNKDKLACLYDERNKMDRDLETGFTSTEKFHSIFSYIKACASIATQISGRKKRWASMGISNLKGITDLQQLYVDLALALYRASKAYLKDRELIGESLSIIKENILKESKKYNWQE